MTEKLFMRDTWKPQSYDEESSSVRVVAVTENPVRVWDWSHKQYVDEVLLIDGFSLPPSGKIPLLDAHNRSSVSNVLGSARRFHPTGNTLECDVFFSGTDAGRNAAQNVKEGHLTDFSVGYFPVEFQFLKEGEVKEIKGRTFHGPVKVTTRWNLRELSLTPIGADQYATARSEDGYMPPLYTPVQPADQPFISEQSAANAESDPGREQQSPIPDQVSSQALARSTEPAPPEVSPEQTALPLEPESAPAFSPESIGAAPESVREKQPVPEVRADAVQKPGGKKQSKTRNAAEPAGQDSERQVPGPPAKQGGPAERNMIDMVFYAFIVLMILCLLKGLF